MFLQENIKDRGKKMNSFNMNTENITYSGISKVIEKATKIPDCIHLEVGDVDFSIPELLKKNLIEAIETGQTHYPAMAGNELLVEKIIELEYSEYGNVVSKENVYVTAGGSFGMFASIMSCINKGDKVVVFEPTWSHFEEMIKLVGGEVVKISLSEKNNYHLTDDVFDKCDKTGLKLILISSPNNPTGTIYNEKDINIITKFAKENDLYILCDQEYEAFQFEEKVLSVFDKYPKSMTSKSISKTLSSSGLRLGYVVGDDVWIDRVKKCGFYSNMYASSIVQYAVGKMIGDKKVFVDDMAAEFKIRADKALEIIRNESDIVCHSPEGAVYIWLDCREYCEDDNYLCNYILEKAHVATVPGSCFGECGKGYLRVSLGRNRDDLLEGINRIVNAVKEIKNA